MDKWQNIETMAALVCATGVVIVAYILHIEGAKDIALAVGGGIVGYLAKQVKQP